MPLKVSAIRRYPVKSMGGQSLESVTVDPRGLAGDRWYAVVDGDGRLASGKSSRRFRRRDAVFDFRAAHEGDRVQVSRGGDRWLVGDPLLDRVLSEAMGTPVRVAAEDGVPHQDAGAVSLVGSASLDWCRTHLGVDADPRRLRVNLVIDTAEPFVEESWVDTSVTAGGAALRIVERIERCRMVDLAQDGVTTGAAFLKALGGERELCLGVYADVERPGSVSVGDALLP
ncbi:MAG: MOSC domain-containing protein [Nocardioidaceae bacterium]